jgi:hypothetical protein
MSLISTSDLRIWIGIEEGDKAPNAKLSAISKAIEDFVDGFTNRKLEAARYNSDPQFTYLDGTGRNWIYSPQYPISYVYGVYVDSDRVFGSGTEIATADIFWYPSGKVISEGGYFTRGHRNIKLDYIAGYAPVVGGTHSALISTYPIPEDLRQVMIEMTVETFKEGITAVHTVAGAGETPPRFVQMLTNNSFWRNVLNKYKAFDAALQGADD